MVDVIKTQKVLNRDFGLSNNTGSKNSRQHMAFAYNNKDRYVRGRAVYGYIFKPLIRDLDTNNYSFAWDRIFASVGANRGNNNIKEQNTTLQVHQLFLHSDSLCNFTLDFDISLGFNQPQSSRFTIYNLRASNTNPIERNSEYFTGMNIGTLDGNVGKQLLLSVSLLSYNTVKTIKQNFIFQVSNCYTTDYPTKKTTFECNCIYSLSSNRANYSQPISVPTNLTGGGITIKKYLEENLPKMSQGNIYLDSNSGDSIDLQKTLKAGTTFPQNMTYASFIKKYMPNSQPISNYRTTTDKKGNNKILEYVSFYNKEQISTTGDNQLDIELDVLEHWKAFNSDKTVIYCNELLNLPTFSRQGHIIQINIFFRPDITIGKYIILQWDKNNTGLGIKSKKMQQAKQQPYKVKSKDEIEMENTLLHFLNVPMRINGVKHNGHFSMATKSEARTTLSAVVSLQGTWKEYKNYMITTLTQAKQNKLLEQYKEAFKKMESKKR